MQEIILQKSSNKDKKFDAFVEGKKVSFGDSQYQDYTQHKDDERRFKYLNRHKPNEVWYDLKTAGTWSRWLLWQKKTIPEAIKFMEDKFKIKIIYKK